MPSSLWVCSDQPPFGMRLAIGDRRARDWPRARARIHRLQEEMGRSRGSRSRAGSSAALRIDELQLIARALHERRAGLGAHADPVDRSEARAACRWSRWRSSKPCACSASIKVLVDLQHRLAAGQHDEGGVPALPARRRGRPAPARRRREFAAALAVGADEIRVAEIAVGRRRGPPRGPTTDCSRQSGRTRPAARPARLRPAACRRSP